MSVGSVTFSNLGPISGQYVFFTTKSIFLCFMFFLYFQYNININFGNFQYVAPKGSICFTNVKIQTFICFLSIILMTYSSPNFLEMNLLIS